MTMKSVDLPHLRSVVLAGHAGAGKTTLAEQLLFRAGAIPRLGRVDDGTAHLDFEPEEQKRQGVAEPRGRDVRGATGRGSRCVDTPGYPDFIADVIEGFAAADGALFVMDASAGVEAGLEHAVALGRSTGTAACFFINKSDRENADPTAALDALRASFGDKIAPIQLAIGAAESFDGLRRPRPPQGLAARTAARRSRSRSRTTWPARSPGGATSSSRRRPRPTTTS